MSKYDMRKLLAKIKALEAENEELKKKLKDIEDDYRIMSGGI